MKINKMKTLCRAKSVGGDYVYGLPEGGLSKFFTWFRNEIGKRFLVHPESICAYAGKKDSEGNLIFEGDVILVKTYFEGETFFEDFVVAFDNNICAFCAFDEKGHPYEGVMDFGDSHVLVVGNVFDNPDVVINWENPQEIKL